jgi:hypothetical protein
MIRGSQIGIPHSKINNVLSGMPRIHFNLIPDSKHIRRKAVEPGKFCHGLVSGLLQKQ